MTTKRTWITCPFCYDEIYKEITTKAGITITVLKNLDESLHVCLDATTNKPIEEIVRMEQWLKCPDCGKTKKTIMNPQEHEWADLQIRCFDCNTKWNITKEEITI